jgi:hypothetical protein
LHTTKVIRQHKQQSDQSEKPCEFDISLSFFSHVTIGRGEQTKLVAIFLL